MSELSREACKENKKQRELSSPAGASLSKPKPSGVPSHQMIAAERALSDMKYLYGLETCHAITPFNSRGSNFVYAVLSFVVS